MIDNNLTAPIYQLLKLKKDKHLYGRIQYL